MGDYVNPAWGDRPLDFRIPFGSVTREQHPQARQGAALVPLDRLCCQRERGEVQRLDELPQQPRTMLLRQRVLRHLEAFNFRVDARPLVVLHPAMGRLWVVAWACLLVVGFAMDARADDPGFPLVRVCVRPPEVPATVWVWGYPSGGRVPSLLMRKPWTRERERLMEMSYPFPIYLFDPDAPAANTKQLPIPYRKLPCAPPPPAEKKEVPEPAPSPPAAPKADKQHETPPPTPPPFVSPKKEMEQKPEPRPRLPKHGVTTDWSKTVLPVVHPSATRTRVLPTRRVLPMAGRSQPLGACPVAVAIGDGTKEGEKKTAEDKIDPVRSKDRSGMGDEPIVAAPAPGLRKPEPPPPGGKDYACSKAIEQARQAAQDADRVGAELGEKFGKALGDAQEALKTLKGLTAGALPRILKKNPNFVDELQSGFASIREVGRLVEQYGGKAANWRKLKGIADIETPSGLIRRAEVHWYQCHGVGRVEFKVKQWID